MRENLSPSLYKKVLFILLEENPFFQRHDIIERVINVVNEFSNELVLAKVYFIIDRRRYIETVVYDGLRNQTSTYINKVSVNEKILDIITSNSCSRIVYLCEEGPHILKNMHEFLEEEHLCLLLGLHTDISSNRINAIRDSGVKVSCVSLNKLSYLTSQCIQIVFYLLALLKEF